MKKLPPVLLASAALFGSFSFASCGDKSENVKVFKDIELTAEHYAFAVKKDDAELKASVGELLDEIKSDGRLEKPSNSYFDGTATFTYENKNTSPKDGDFIVATNAAFSPFEALEGNKFKGADIEIASKIAEKLDKKLFIKNMDFTGAFPACKAAKGKSAWRALPSSPNV